MAVYESYEATINVRHISTSPKARNSLSLEQAQNKAISNLRYITRASATWDGDIIGHSQGVTMIAENPADRRAAKEMTSWALNERAGKHRPNTGIRLADTLIVSLPRDATPEHHREMVAGILSDLGGDSDAWLIGAIHRDREGNPHAHILAIDGLESLAEAKARRTEAKRVRRADALRLNQGGNRQALRARIATQINTISDREGYRRAEVRSYEDRGVTKAPNRHLGPTKIAMDQKIKTWLLTSVPTDDETFGHLNFEEPKPSVKAEEDLRMQREIQDRLDEREVATSSRKKNNMRD